MAPDTLKNKIRFWFADKWGNVEYWFTKRWLDRHFGEQEYWGDYIAELEFNQRQIDLLKKQIDENLKMSSRPPIYKENLEKELNK